MRRTRAKSSRVFPRAAREQGGCASRSTRVMLRQAARWASHAAVRGRVRGNGSATLIDVPPMTRYGGGASGAAAIVGEAAAVGVNAALRHSSTGLGQMTREWYRAGRGPCCAPRSAGSAVVQPYRDDAARANTCAVAPSSTSLPAYSTPTRSHIRPITARLWLMNSTAVPSSSRKLRDEVEHFGFDGGVEPGRRFVEDQQGLGLVASAMAITTRCCMPPDKLMRIAVHHAIRVTAMRTRCSMLDRAARLRARETRQGRRLRPAAARSSATDSARGPGS